MPEKKEKKSDTDVPVAFYFKSLTIRDVKCFRGDHHIDLSGGDGLPAQWTVILGNNNTGKTTILKCLASFDLWGRKTIVEYWASVFSNTTGVDYNPITSELYISEEMSNQIRDAKFSSKVEFADHLASAETKYHKNLRIEAYGASRKMASKDPLWNGYGKSNLNLFQNEDLFNAEAWLLQLNLAKLQGKKDQKSKAEKIIDRAKEIMTSGLLPDVSDLRFASKEQGQSFDNFIEFKTDFGWIRLNDLGYGYQTMLAWVLDLVRRMFERYPESPNPIREPSIVLVDEID
ncbi:MAG: ATP-binding protein, partial [Saprospiraceae bacterium]|nr:ATP-binding protein [Saprospiraceae bacterium]